MKITHTADGPIAGVPDHSEQRRRRPGRKSDYSIELAREICARMLQRDDLGRMRSMRDICRDADMPSESQVFSWLSRQREFSDMYARAREERAHMAAEDIVQIADSEPDPNLARVRIDARKWYAAKLNAKHYGDKLDLNGNLTVGLTDEQIEARIAVLLAKAAGSEPQQSVAEG